MIQFQVKVCGVTRAEDIAACVAAGVSAIGLNFYAPSPRSVTPEKAEVLVESIPLSVAKVGVFVNHAVPEIETICERIGLDFVQLHGDESLETAMQLMAVGLSVIKVFRIPGTDDPHAENENVQKLAAEFRPKLDTWCNAGVRGVLLDTLKAGAFGGTGSAFPWRLVRRMDLDCPIVLAGGLNPDNVAEAILASRPFAVDVASGVESSPGVKDLEAVEKFVKRSNAAFGELGKIEKDSDCQ